MSGVMVDSDGVVPDNVDMADLVAERIRQVAVDVEGRKCALLGIAIGAVWTRKRLELTLNLMDPETGEILVQMEPVRVKSGERRAGFTLNDIRVVIPVKEPEMPLVVLP